MKPPRLMWVIVDDGGRLIGVCFPTRKLAKEFVDTRLPSGWAGPIDIVRYNLAEGKRTR